MSDLTINIKTDCGNSPKRKFIRDYNIAFAKGDVEFILTHASDDIVWEIFGDRKIEGKESFQKALEEMKSHKIKAITIHHIITHGKEGAVNGEMLMSDDKRYAFSDVYEFVSAGKTIIKHMYSYIVAV